MTYFIFTLIVLDILAMNFVKEDGKKVLYCLLFLLMFIFMGGSEDKPDYDVYYQMYNGGWTLNKLEFGFGILISICNSLHIDYNGFYLVMTFLGLFLIFYSSYRIIKISPLFCFFYVIWPFFMDIVQVRNFLAMGFVFFAFSELVVEKKHYKIKFIVSMIMGASFQTVALAYFPLIFIDKLEKKKFVSFILIVTIILAVLMSFNIAIIEGLINQFNFILNFDERYSSYTDNMVRIGYLFNWGLQLCNVFFAWWSKKIVHDNVLYCHENHKKIASLTFYINIFMFVFCPVYRLNSNFTRLMRNIMPINYLSFIISYQSFQKRDNHSIKLEKLTYLLLYFVYISIIIIVQLFIPHKITIIDSVFNNRWLF